MTTLQIGATFGLTLIAVGALVILWVRRDRWSEDCVACAEATTKESPEARRQRLMVKVSTPTQKNAGDMDDLWAELLATPRVPKQRDRSDWTGGA